MTDRKELNEAFLGAGSRVIAAYEAEDLEALMQATMDCIDIFTQVVNDASKSIEDAVAQRDAAVAEVAKLRAAVPKWRLFDDIPTTPTQRQIALRRLSGAIRRKYGQRDINAAVEALWGTSLTCLDGGCIFGHPGGMHTNGGCQHTKSDLLTHLLMLRYLAEQLDVEVSDEP